MAGRVTAFRQQAAPRVPAPRALARLIRDGTYPPGSRLPSEAELSETYEVARPTVRQALGRLRDQGLIRTLHGRGSVVVERP